MYTPRTIGKNGNRRPHPVIEFKEKIAAHLHAELPSDFSVLDSPLKLSVMAWFPRTASDTRKTMPNPPLWKTGPPDSDNVAKSVMDCMTEIVWRDDSLVCELMARKGVVEPGQQPGVEILIETLSGVPTHLLSDRKGAT